MPSSTIIRMEFKLNSSGYYEAISDTTSKLSYPEKGNEDCYELEKNSQWFNARNQTILDALNRFPVRKAFIDVGGGNGYQLKFLQQHYFEKRNITSALCEPGVAGCANAAGRGVQNVYCVSSDDFPFKKFNADGIGLFDVIEHIEDDIGFLKSISDQVKPGTRFYITVPALESLTSAEDHYAGHFRRFNWNHTMRLSEGSGLRIIHQTYFFSYYVVLVWLLRVLPEKLGKIPPNEELMNREKGYHKQSSFLNFVLNSFHKVEALCIRLNLKPCCGTSRLIILEK